MTTEPTPLEPKVLDFTSPPREVERTLFRIDGEDYYAIKPKGGQMMRLGIEAANVQTNGDLMDLADAYLLDGFMDTCFEQESGERMRSRLEDPDDPFDLDTLMEVMNALQKEWGRRPPTRSPGSSPRRARSGRTSTGRARSRG